MWLRQGAFDDRTVFHANDKRATLVKDKSWMGKETERKSGRAHRSLYSNHTHTFEYWICHI